MEAVHVVALRVDGEVFTFDGEALSERWASPDGREERVLLCEAFLGGVAASHGLMSLYADVRVRHQAQPDGAMAIVVIHVHYTSNQGERLVWKHAAKVALNYPVELLGNGVRVVVEKRPARPG